MTIAYNEVLRERIRDHLAGHDRRVVADPTKRHAAVAVLLVEHNVDFVVAIADYLYVLDQGQLIAEGVPADVMRNPAVIDSYTGKVR